MSRLCPQCTLRYPEPRRYCNRCLTRLESQPPMLVPLQTQTTPERTVVADAWLRLMRHGRPTEHRTPVSAPAHHLGRRPMVRPEGRVHGLVGLNAFEQLHISMHQITLERGPNGRWSLMVQPRSTHLVFVEGEPVVRRAALREGAHINIGGVVFRFEAEGGEG